MKGLAGESRKVGRFSVFPGQAFQTCPVLPGHEYDTLFTPVLSIVSVSSVFSVVVFVLELLGGGLDPLVDGFCAVGHFGYFFEYYCIVDGFVGVFSSGEGAVVLDVYKRQDLGFDLSRLNVNGGAIALGHPVGCSGCRILVTLLHEMQKRDAKTGLATLCVGGGMGCAAIVKRD